MPALIVASSEITPAAKIVIGLIAASGVYAAGRLAGFVIAMIRSARLKKLAARLGLTFTGKPPESEGLDKFRGFPFFSEQGKARMSNYMYGETGGARLMLFDVEMVKTTDVGSFITYYTVAAMDSKSLDLPRLRLKPESYLDKFSKDGENDIDFSNHPEFSGKYLLTGDDEAAVRRWFNNAVIDFFEWNWARWMEAEGGRFIYYSGLKLLPVREVEWLVREAMELHERFTGASGGGKKGGSASGARLPGEKSDDNQSLFSRTEP